MAISLRSELKVADEVWIATALLHREHPGSADFSIAQIVRRVQREGLYGSLRPGVYIFGCPMRYNWRARPLRKWICSSQTMNRLHSKHVDGIQFLVSLHGAPL
jgi:hypothetical protein